jgi:myo-inositol-1-phosphate synthase
MTDRIRVGIVGAGNCASALVQGVEYYREAGDGSDIPGLMHARLGGYHVSDIQFSCAFDVDADKVGTDLAKALVSGHNNTIRFAEVPETGVIVSRGPTLDGLGRYYRQEIVESPAPPVDVAKVLRDTRTQVLVNYLPVGSERAAKFYAEQALEAGVGFVNCMPVFISSHPAWASRFAERGTPLIGDDVKSQVGSTIIHRVLAKLFEDRGVHLDHTYQLNFGGNMDFMNMLERERLTSKKISKTQSVTSQLRRSIGSENIHIGPSDHVPWLEDRKWAHIRIEGREFGDVPITVDLKLEVWDSPNSAGVVIDAIRCIRLALDAGVGGALLGPSAYFMKSPPVQYSDDVARQMVEEYIRSVGMTTRLDAVEGELNLQLDEVH